MKRMFTLLGILLLTSATLLGQNSLSRAFGSGYEEVKTFLASKKFLNITSDNKSEIVVRTSTYSYTYFFQNEKLYKTELVKVFKDRKDAESTVESFRNFYAMAHAEVMTLADSKQHERFAALRDRELSEVSKVYLDKKTVQVRQVSMDLDMLPGQEMADLRIDQNLYSMLDK